MSAKSGDSSLRSGCEPTDSTLEAQHYAPPDDYILPHHDKLVDLSQEELLAIIKDLTYRIAMDIAASTQAATP